MKKSVLTSILLLHSFIIGYPLFAADSDIRLNSIGFLPGQEKRASIAASCAQFEIIDSANGQSVYQASIIKSALNSDTGETLWTADFSPFNQPGRYYLNVPGVGRSTEFSIGDDIYNSVFYTVMRGMYLWRCGTEVNGIHNGNVYSHKACHTKDAYTSYVSKERVIRIGTKGWHDAGDYNKYVVNAGVTVGVMFLAWEQYQDLLEHVSLDIPETTDSLPDYLDEMKWEMDWILTMQADDGSVYHKLSTTTFGGFIKPEAEMAYRFFTPWSSAATADFVAMTAMAARIFAPFDATYATQCLEAAKKSYAFLQQIPADHQPDLKYFSTGGYTTQDSDDRLWAAAELWQTTGDTDYLQDFETRAKAHSNKIDSDWDWSNVKNLGMFTYFLSSRSGKDTAIHNDIRSDILSTANTIVGTRDKHGYGRPLGTKYYWGCNGSVARQATILQIANQISPDPKYINTALDALGHLFGRNFYNRSFVTGIGLKPPMQPHDRRSGSDALIDPWPGYLVGGGWPKARDWKDIQADYETNEIAINWNSALIYALAGFIKQEDSQSGIEKAWILDNTSH